MAQFLGDDFPGHSAHNMNQLLFPRLAVSSAFCAILSGCASTEDAGPSPVLRTAPPQGYEKAIENFFAFKIRGARTTPRSP